MQTMKAMTRRVIYFTRDASPELLASFEERDWEVEVIGSVRDVRRAVDDGSLAAGLVDLSSVFDVHDIAALEGCLAMPNVGWVAMTATPELDEPAVRRLVRDYCFDYVTLPAAHARIVDTVGHACGMIALGEPAFVDTSMAEGEMIGSCDAMLALFRSIRKVATTDASVFVYGESGTGKELTAAAIHARSPRRNEPFVAINCGAIPPHLLQSELFGYERGAFTGASQRKIGRVEAAHGGTLFLDEIGDMPLPLQGKLLRVLQDKEFEPLGSNRIVRADVRIIAATSADLSALVAAGRFRADLFYRLNVLTIQAPALRERLSDIEALAYAMLEDLSTQARGASHFELQDDALQLLCSYGWPGNVRELRNTLERAVMLSDSERIDARALAPFIGPSHGGHRPQVSMVPETQASDPASVVPGATSWSEAMAGFEKRYLSDALRANGGRVIETAMQIGMGRATLYKKIAAYGIEV